MLANDMRKMFTEKQVGEIAKKTTTGLYRHVILDQNELDLITIISTQKDPYILGSGTQIQFGYDGVIALTYYSDDNGYTYNCYRVEIGDSSVILYTYNTDSGETINILWGNHKPDIVTKL